MESTNCFRKHGPGGSRILCNWQRPLIHTRLRPGESRERTPSTASAVLSGALVLFICWLLSGRLCVASLPEDYEDAPRPRCCMDWIRPPHARRASDRAADGEATRIAGANPPDAPQKRAMGGMAEEDRRTTAGLRQAAQCAVPARPAALRQRPAGALERLAKAPRGIAEGKGQCSE